RDGPAEGEDKCNDISNDELEEDESEVKSGEE
ncbi:hypothetical protein Tco_1279413, partial [Tanacetum coccineum]